jgi:alkanesulfonate monooxygenase SsuD/methylene tetrahydromethanopterin reductase-like flavin-dependent oxidoreductase (luciferase family)
LMKAAWSDEPRVTFAGRFRQVDGLPIQPKPVQRPHPPIWFGGQAPKALARAVRHGDHSWAPVHHARRSSSRR